MGNVILEHDVPVPRFSGTFFFSLRTECSLMFFFQDVSSLFNNNSSMEYIYSLENEVEELEKMLLLRDKTVPYSRRPKISLI